jgi:hypothetical protein
MPRRSLAAALVVAPLCTAFTPFSTVGNVCPTCAPPSAADVVVLTSGERIACNVVAQNADYYTLRWHGEVRSAEKAEVAKIEWHGAHPNLQAKDQIRTKSGVVLDGKIVDEQAGRFLIIEMNGLKYVVWAEQLKDAHKAGSRYSLPAAPTVLGAGT